MAKNSIKHGVNDQLAAMLLETLRKQWAECWGLQQHAYISRSILLQSLAYRQQELAGGGFFAAQAAQTDVMKSEADANRNVSSGTKTLLEDTGEAVVKSQSELFK